MRARYDHDRQPLKPSARYVKLVLDRENQFRQGLEGAFLGRNALQVHTHPVLRLLGQIVLKVSRLGKRKHRDELFRTVKSICVDASKCCARDSCD